MKETQKKIIQSAAIRIGVGLASIFVAYFLKEQEVYQKVCYAFGYFFVIYNLVIEILTAISKKKLHQEPEKIVLLVVTLVSILGFAFGWYILSILIMLLAVSFDALMKCSRSKTENHPYPLYIFDLDGTIADTLESMGNTCNQVLEEHGFAPHPLEAYKTFVGDAVGKLIERALLAAGDTVAENGLPTHYETVLEGYKARFATTCTQNVTAYEGMQETLAQLKADGARLAVFTNKRHPQAVEVVETVYGKGFFDAILGEGNGFARKPSPDGAVHLAELFGIEPKQCVYIGDTNTDMETGIAAGMYTVGVTWGFRAKEELEAYSPAQIIDTPKELLDIHLP